ncbi:hypothetical protein B7463_g6074, partial [Scytalidium lignicola]
MTSRPEDIAYCLLGIFDVNIPLIHGEGREKAFIRLQQEFLKFSDDETIFAWKTDSIMALKKPYWGLLSTSPRFFKEAYTVYKPRFKSRLNTHPTNITNRGVHIELSIEPLGCDKSGTIYLGILHCIGSTGGALAIVLQRISNVEPVYTRIVPDLLVEILHSDFPIPVSMFSPYFREEYTHQAYQRGLNRDDFDFAHYSVTQPKAQSIFVRSISEVLERITGLYLSSPTILRTPIEDSVEGSLEARVTDYSSGWSEFHKDGSDDGREIWCKIKYVSAGVEPLPPNPFRTAPTFIKPWYIISERPYSNENLIPDSDNYQLPNDFSLEAGCATGIQQECLLYKTDLFLIVEDIS